MPRPRHRIRTESMPDGWTYPCTMILPFRPTTFRDQTLHERAAELIQNSIFGDNASAAGFFIVDDVRDHESPPPGEHRTVIEFTIERPDHETDYCDTFHVDGHDPFDDAAAILQLQAEIDEALKINVSNSLWSTVTVTVDRRHPIPAPGQIDGSTGTTIDSPDQPDLTDPPQPRDTEGRYTMSTPTTFPTTQTRTVETPVSLYVRPSTRNDDTIVVGVETGGERKRAVLVRVLDDGSVRVRTLDGNPREASSNTSGTQTVLEFAAAELTDDPA